jgi:hypothetical protein
MALVLEMDAMHNHTLQNRKFVNREFTFSTYFKQTSLVWNDAFHLGEAFAWYMAGNASHPLCGWLLSWVFLALDRGIAVSMMGIVFPGYP